MVTHDLADFMHEVTEQIASEYKRIQRRASEDPGTAGDQGEENWAMILRGWLPANMHVVTKGRILSDKGIASPQVDVIVLSPEYPKHLLAKKLYLAGGVLAAFECKTTLKSKHLRDFIANSIEIKDHALRQSGTPFKELNSSILYGLLAHSHSWKGKNSKPIETITNKLLESDEALVTHPRQMPDVICVADLACWKVSKGAFIGPQMGSAWNQALADVYGKEGSATTYYDCHSSNNFTFNPGFTSIGILICSLMFKLSRNMPSLRPMAGYYLSVLSGSSEGIGRKWPLSVYTKEVQMQLRSNMTISLNPYDDWGFKMD